MCSSFVQSKGKMSTSSQECELESIMQEKLNLSEGDSVKEIKNYSLDLEKVKDLECPFTWKFDFTDGDVCVISKMEDKLSELVDDDEKFVAWKKFVCHLVLCFEFAQAGELGDAFEELDKIETIMQEKSSETTSITVMREGIVHVLLACKCHVLLLDGGEEEMKEIVSILQKITFLDEMTDTDAASLYCMKGAFCCEYGYTGIKSSLQYINKGLSLDDKCPEWHFLLGRTLSRLRRIERRGGLPEKEELEALEKAATLADNASFYVILAQSYREAARNVFWDKKDERSVFKPLVDSMNKKSLEIIRKVLSKDTKNAHINMRCALGLMKLPAPWKDLNTARTCILKALQEAPNNPMANHIAGNYYSQVKNYQMALHHYAKAAASKVYGADIDAIVLKKTINRSYDPMPDLLRCLDVYKEKPRKLSTLCYLGAHYYFFEKNFKKAFEYWSEMVDVDIHNYKLTITNDTILFRSDQCINEIMVRELTKLLKEGNISEEEECKYRKILMKYREIMHDIEIEEELSSAASVKSASWRSSVPRERSSAYADGPRRGDNLESANTSGFRRKDYRESTNAGGSTQGDNSASANTSGFIRKDYRESTNAGRSTQRDNSASANTSGFRRKDYRGSTNAGRSTQGNNSASANTGGSSQRDNLATASASSRGSRSGNEHGRGNQRPMI